MATEWIITQKRGRIGVATLNRPESRNTSTVPFAEQLDQALSTMGKDPDVLVVVINANGKHFSTGISLDQFHYGSQREYREFLYRIDAFYHTLARMKKSYHGPGAGICSGQWRGPLLCLRLDGCRRNGHLWNHGDQCRPDLSRPRRPLSKILGREKPWKWF